MKNNAKHWILRAVQLLDSSLKPVPQELNELDWKSSLSNQRDRLTEHLIAFSNYSGGGFLIYGIEDMTAKLKGIVPADVNNIVNTIANLGRDAIEPAFAIDHAVVDYQEIPLLFIYIPEHSNKPAHRRGKSIEETWIRSGGTTRKASRHEIASLMLNSQAPRWEELRASPLLSIRDIFDALNVDGIFKLRERPLPDDQHEVLRWLIDEKMAVADNDGFYITNFGAISAARRLDDFDSLRRKAIRVVRYIGVNKVDAIDEMVGQKGYAVGFEGLITYIKRALPHSEIIKQSLRTEVSVFPEIALRELIANALIHQDFNISGAGPMIDIYSDRVEFTNPGSLLPSKRLDRLIGTTPESRNEVLASAFRLYRICEERGTGFQKVVSAVELFGMPAVAFTPLENAFRVTLYSPRKFAEMSQSERLEACYQHAVLKYLSSGSLTNTSLRERLKMHEKQRTQVSNLIRDAVEAGRIKRKDPESSSSKFAEYIPYWV